MSFLFWFIIAPAGAVMYFFFKSYNQLQRASQQVKEGASNIKVMLRKKLELTTQLMDVCKGYTDHEQLVNLKVSADMADSLKDLGSANARAEQAMALMTQMASRFPNLKADQQFITLSRQLTELGAELQSKREWYNRYVRDYNAERITVPTVFVARAMSFPEASYLTFDGEGSMDVLQTFETDDGAKLEAMLGTIGNKVSHAGASVAKRAKEATSAAVEIGKEKLSKPKYRYSSSGKPSEPISRKDLDQLAAAGTITPNTYVLADGGKTWITYSDLIAKDAPPPAPDACIPPPPDATASAAKDSR